MRRRLRAGCLRRSAIAFASLAVALVAAEVAVRATPAAYSTGYRPASNPRLVYELEPGHAMPSIRGRISAQGLNDREFPVAKPPGVYRIAVVSDSTAFGWKVPLEESFAKVLERRLRESLRRPFEVINFSVPGYNAAQEVEVVREKVLTFSPDMVILVFNGNDVFLCNYIQPDPTLLGMLAHASYLAHLVVGRIDAALAAAASRRVRFPAWWLRVKARLLGVRYPQVRYYPRPGLEEVPLAPDRNPPRRPAFVPDRYHYMLGYENYRVHLAAIRDMLRDRHIAFVSTGGLSRDALRIHRELAIAHVVGLRPGDLAGRSGDAGSLVIEGDDHWNVRGHGLAAERVLEYLVAQRLL